MEAVVFDKALERMAEIGWSGLACFHFFNEPLLEKSLEEKVRAVLKICPNCAPTIYTNADGLTEKRCESLLAAGVVKFQITRHPPYSCEWDSNIANLAEKYPAQIHFHTIENQELNNRQGLVKIKRQQDLCITGCSAPSQQLIIDIHGRYLFCCCDFNRQEIMGNVFSCGILGAWANKRHSEARTSVRKAVPILDICKACFREVAR